MAGLKRLGLAHRARAALDIEAFLPAVGQGAIALGRALGDARTREALAAIGDAETATALAAERAFLAELDGSCRTPIAGHARLEDGRLTLRGQVLREDGSESFEARVAGPPADAARLGAEAGRDLLAAAAARRARCRPRPIGQIVALAAAGRRDGPAADQRRAAADFPEFLALTQITSAPRPTKLASKRRTPPTDFRRGAGRPLLAGRARLRQMAGRPAPPDRRTRRGIDGRWIISVVLWKRSNA